MSPFQGPAGNSIDKSKLRGFERRMLMRYQRRASDLVNLLPPGRLLDVGCGEGHMIHAIVNARPGVYATGIDAADQRLMYFWQQLSTPRLEFRVADVCALPFKDNEFQLVTAFGSLEHIADPDRALAEICRVCNGCLVVGVPWEPFWRLGNLARGRYWRKRGNTPGHINHWTRRRFGKLLRRHGRIQHLEVTPMWSLASVVLDEPREARAARV